MYDVEELFCKACGDPRVQHDEYDLSRVVGFVMDDKNTRKLVEIVDRGGWGAWNMPPHISLLIRYVLASRGVRLAKDASNFLTIDSSHGIVTLLEIDDNPLR